MMSEQHLDLLALVARSLVLGCPFEPSHDIARGFVHASRDFAHGLSSTKISPLSLLARTSTFDR